MIQILMVAKTIVLQKQYLTYPCPIQLIFALSFGALEVVYLVQGPSTTKYGGNTTCFEVTCGRKRIIIDAGTGVRLLGKQIMLNEGNLLDADLFLTHTHMDHIQGLPFFALCIIRIAMSG